MVRKQFRSNPTYFIIYLKISTRCRLKYRKKKFSVQNILTLVEDYEFYIKSMNKFKGYTYKKCYENCGWYLYKYQDIIFSVQQKKYRINF